MSPRSTEDDDDDWSAVDEDNGVIGIEEGPPAESADGEDGVEESAEVAAVHDSTAGLTVTEHSNGTDDDAGEAKEMPCRNDTESANAADDDGEVKEAPSPSQPARDAGDTPHAKFFEGDKAMLVPTKDGDSSDAEPVKVRIVKVDPPHYVIALPDGAETSIPFSANDALLALDEFESLQTQREAENLGVVTTCWYGGDGGGPFDDMPDVDAGWHRTRRIVEVGVRCGSIVDGIRVAYSDSSTISHGGEGGGEQTFALGGGEYITEAVVRYGRYVQRLTFVTNLGRTLGPFGGGGALFLGLTGTEVRVRAPDRHMLAAFHGRCGKFLDGIGFHWAPVTARTEAVSKDDLCTRLKRQLLKSSECYGGDGGAEFDDGHYNIRITDVTVRTGSNSLVKGIEVRYYNGKVGSYGGANKLGSSGKESSLSMEKGEYIIKALVQYGEFVRSLSFITSTGRQLGPCGEMGGGEDGSVQDAVVQAPEGHMIVGIKGRSGSLLDSIGFNFSPAPTK